MIKLGTKNGQLSLSQKMLKGDPGGYYKPNVDEDGNLIWTATEEEMEPAESANIKGPIGEKGESGVYVGDTEPSEEFDVWIKPNEMPSYVMTKEEVQEYIDQALWEVEYGSY